MIRRITSVALAASALAGLSTAVVPQHAASLAALAAGTVVAVAATFVLVLAGPLVVTVPPPWPARTGARRPAPPLDPQGLRDARRAVAAQVAAGADVRDLLDPERARRTPTGGHR